MARSSIISVLLIFLSFACAFAAQEPAKTPRIGYVSGRPATSPGPLVAAFRKGLRDVGYVEGKNIIVEYRYGAAENAAFERAIADLLGLKVDLLVMPIQVAAAKRLVKNTPIVMISNFDPVNSGLIYSLAQPGGNITGVTTLSRALSNRRLELLQEIVPKLTTLGVLRNTDSLFNSRMHLKEIEVAARDLNVKLELFDVHSTKPKLENAFEAAAKMRVEALLTLTPLLIDHQKRIADLAIKHLLPTAFEGNTWVEAGGLMSYSADEPALFRRAAVYVDKILKGAKPMDLVVEEPTKFQFALNLGTAKKLGLNIPPAVIRRADTFIR